MDALDDDPHAPRALAVAHEVVPPARRPRARAAAAVAAGARLTRQRPSNSSFEPAADAPAPAVAPVAAPTTPPSMPARAFAARVDARHRGARQLVAQLDGRETRRGRARVGDADRERRVPDRLVRVVARHGLADRAPVAEGHDRERALLAARARGRRPRDRARARSASSSRARRREARRAPSTPRPRPRS